METNFENRKQKRLRLTQGLPADTVGLALTFLSPQNRFKIATTCKLFHNLVYSRYGTDQIWMQVIPIAINNNVCNWPNAIQWCFDGFHYETVVKNALTVRLPIVINNDNAINDNNNDSDNDNDKQHKQYKQSNNNTFQTLKNIRKLVNNANYALIDRDTHEIFYKQIITSCLKGKLRFCSFCLFVCLFCDEKYVVPYFSIAISRNRDCYYANSQFLIEFIASLKNHCKKASYFVFAPKEFFRKKHTTK